MNGLPYYKAYPRDFFEGTVGMPGELKGAYRLVLDLIYMHDGNLPDDAAYISCHLGVTVRQWGFHRKRLIELGKLFVRGAFIASSRADQELFATRSYRVQQSINGSQPKKNKHIPEADACPKTSHTDTDTDTDKKEKRERGAKAPKPSRARKPETDLPDEWVPSDRNISDASARGLSEKEIEHEGRRFRDYHLSRGSRFRDWDAAWRTWLGNYRRPTNGSVAFLPYAAGGRSGRSLASIAAQRRLGDAN